MRLIKSIDRAGGNIGDRWEPMYMFDVLYHFNQFNTHLWSWQLDQFNTLTQTASDCDRTNILTLNKYRNGNFGWVLCWIRVAESCESWNTQNKDKTHQKTHFRTKFWLFSSVTHWIWPLWPVTRADFWHNTGPCDVWCAELIEMVQHWPFVSGPHDPWQNPYFSMSGTLVTHDWQTIRNCTVSPNYCFLMNFAYICTKFIRQNIYCWLVSDFFAFIQTTNEWNLTSSHVNLHWVLLFNFKWDLPWYWCCKHVLIGSRTFNRLVWDNIKPTTYWCEIISGWSRVYCWYCNINWCKTMKGSVIISDFD